MQSFALSLVVFTLCVTQPSAAYRSRFLLEGGFIRSSSSTSGNARTSTSIRTRGGIATVYASGKASAESVSVDSIVNYFNQVAESNAVIQPGPNEDHTSYCLNVYNSIQDEIKAIGTAFARAYAEAFASIEIHGSGSGCASASASAESEATALAQVLADAFVQSELGTTTSQANVAFSAQKNVYVQAYASAKANACLEQAGSSNSVQTYLAEVLVHPIAIATIKLIANIECGDAVTASTGSVTATTQTKLTIESNGSSETTGNPSLVSNTGEGYALAAVQCVGKYASCCSNDVFASGVCSCTAYEPCNAALDGSYGRLLWLDRSGDTHTCYCSY